MTGSAAEATALFARERRRLLGVAYRMLGTVSDTEDVLQDVFERWLAADRSAVDNPAAYLTTMTTRRCIDHLRSARHLREVYVGPWLPEPVLTAGPPGDGPGLELGPGADPADVAELDESITIGYLHLLEQLSPTERAVHLLREVFDFPYREIASMVGKDEAHCRQISSRARTKLKASRPERLSAPAPDVEAEVGNALVAAVIGGDVGRVMALLTDDVVHISDGGPNRRAARHPIVGPERVARLLVNLAARLTPSDPTVPAPALDLVPVRVNLQFGYLVLVDERPLTLMAFEVVGERVRRVHAVVNPDKLGPVMAQLGLPVP